MERKRRRVTGGSVFRPVGTKFWWVRWRHQRKAFQIATSATTKKEARRWLTSPLVQAVIDKVLAPMHKGRWGKKRY